MAAEFTINASLEGDNGVFDAILSINGLRFDFTAALASQKYIRNYQSIGTSEEAIVLGETSGSLGWGIFINRDNTNYLELRMATGAAYDMIKLPAKGGCALFYFGSDVTAPFAIANTAACLMEYLIFTQ